MKKDNSEGDHKTIVRQRVAGLIGNDSVVLETMCGGGTMYERVWNRFTYGIAIDKDEKKVAAQAARRPSWGCYCGDSIRALADSWLADVEFGVVDIDAYGDPWGCVLAFIDHHRAYPESGTTIVVTDGFWPQRNSTWWPKTISNGERRSGISDELYIDIVAEVVVNRCFARGLEADHLLSERRKRWAQGVGQHAFRIGRPERVDQSGQQKGFGSTGSPESGRAPQRASHGG